MSIVNGFTCYKYCRLTFFLPLSCYQNPTQQQMASECNISLGTSLIFFFIRGLIFLCVSIAHLYWIFFNIKRWVHFPGSWEIVPSMAKQEYAVLWFKSTTATIQQLYFTFPLFSKLWSASWFLFFHQWSCKFYSQFCLVVPLEQMGWGS